MTDADRRFAAVAVAGTFVTATLLSLVGVVAHVFATRNAEWATSGPAATVAAAVFVVGLSTMFFLLVAASTFAVWRPDASRPRRAVQAVLSVVLIGPPLFLTNAFLLGPFSPVPLPLPWHLQFPLALGAVVLPGVVTGWRLARTRAAAVPWTAWLNVALVGALLCGFLLGTAVGIPLESHTVETGTAFAPQATFATMQ